MLAKTASCVAPHKSQQEASMFPVEVSIFDEDTLVETMETMRTWLDHQHFEPAFFRYKLGAKLVVLRIDFAIETEASAFAKAFSGKVVV